MANTNKKRRPDLNGYTYSVYAEVDKVFPVTSDQGERANIFITELCRLSISRNLTLGADRNTHIYFKATHIKAILSHTKYSEILNQLSAAKIIRRVLKSNVYGYDLYTFSPVQYEPLKRSRGIRNLKVRNGMRRYLGLRGESIDPELFRTLNKSLREIRILLDESTFFALAQGHYPIYRQEKESRYLKPMSEENYLRLQADRYNGIREYNQLSKTERALFVKQDNFGGRVYTVATGLPRWVRPYLRLADEEIVEIDLYAAHPTLLYNLLEETDFGAFIRNCTRYNEDIYTMYQDMISAGSRGEAKLRFLRGVYGRVNSKYYLEFKASFPGAGVILDEIKTVFSRTNPSRGKGAHTNLVFKITKREVKIFSKVWTALDGERIPFIPLHDAIILRRSDLEAGLEIIQTIIRRSIPIANFKIIHYY